MPKLLKTQQPNPAQKEGSSLKASNGAHKDGEAFLRADHRRVEALFDQFKTAEDAAQKRVLVESICAELVMHAWLEESVFYPACREKKVESDLLDEAQVEHDSLKVLIGDLMTQDSGSPFYDAKVTVLSEHVKHHVAEEEKPRDGILSQARRAAVDMAALGELLQQRRHELVDTADEGFLQPMLHAIRNQASRDGQERFVQDEGRGRFSGRYTREQDQETGGRQFGPDGNGGLHYPYNDGRISGENDRDRASDSRRHSEAAHKRSQNRDE